MKRSSKYVSLLLSALIALSAPIGCSNSNSNSNNSSQASSTPAQQSAAVTQSSTPVADSGQYTITMAYIGGDQPNQDNVRQALREQTQKDINMDFELIQMGFGDYQDRLNLMLSGGDKLDIFPIFFTNSNSYINAGQVVDLSQYIDQYGKDIINFMGADVAKSGAVNGFIYGIPSNKESASLAGIVMRKDIVDELGIDVSKIKTYDDLTPIFAKVKAAHPDMDCIAGTNLVSQIQISDPLTDSFGVLMNQGQDTNVVNLFETDFYKTRVHRIYDWYKAGYIKLDAATTTETNENLVKSGSLFSFLSSIKPAFLIQENAACGMELVTAYLGNDDGTPLNMISSVNVNFYDWGIAQQSIDKVKAMQFLNYAYSSPEWNNLMNFGVENEDYVRVSGSDKLIDFPAGKDASSAYHLNMGWMLPNQFIGYVWNGQPDDIWQQYQTFNASATYSKAFGFFYDSSSVANELSALFGVTSQYQKPLETGSVTDVDATLKEFNDQLYAAGLQKVMDLKQQQLNAWLASH